MNFTKIITNYYNQSAGFATPYIHSGIASAHVAVTAAASYASATWRAVSSYAIAGLNRAAPYAQATAACVMTPTGATVAVMATVIFIALIAITTSNAASPEPQKEEETLGSNPAPNTPVESQESQDAVLVRPQESTTPGDHQKKKTPPRPKNRPNTPIMPEHHTEVAMPSSALKRTDRGHNTSNAHKNTMIAREQNTRRKHADNYRYVCDTTGESMSSALLAAIDRGAVTYPRKLADERITAHNQRQIAALSARTYLGPTWKSPGKSKPWWLHTPESDTNI